MKQYRHVTVAFTADEYDSLQRMAIAAYASPRMSGVAKVIEEVMRDVIKDEQDDHSAEQAA